MDNVKRILAYGIMIFVCLYTASADIVSINSGGSTYVAITPTNYWEGFFFGEITTTGGNVSGGGGGGGLPPTTAAEIAKITVEVIGMEHTRGDNVRAEIIINNPDSEVDVTIVYYLSNPNAEVFDETKEIIKKLDSGTTTLNKKLSIPNEAEYGNWRFNVLYMVPGQPNVLAYDSFEVYPSSSRTDVLKLVGLVLIVLLVFTFHRERKKRQQYYDQENSGELEDESSKQ